MIAGFITGFLLLAGGVFMLLAAVGIVRMPDLYSRIQAAAKASTLGAGLVVLGLIVHFGELAVSVRALLVIALLFLTAPVAGHMIGRAAYISGVPLWKHAITDELRENEADRPEKL